MSRRVFAVSNTAAGRLTMIRQTARHMARGGAVLSYPGGRIEPDPAHRGDAAAAALDQWSHSAALFARQVPGLTIVPVAVSGVLSRPALHHPLTRLRRSRREREWLAATLQMLIPSLADMTTNVAFGSPIAASALADVQSSRTAVLAEMQRLIRISAAR